MTEGLRFTLGKEERVTGIKRIEKLFADGRFFFAYPFRIVYLEYECEHPVPVSVMVSIPKKRLKSAVKRNRMKRLFREAYRLNKHLFINILQADNSQLDIVFVYVKNELSDFDEIERSVNKAFCEIAKEKKITESC